MTTASLYRALIWRARREGYALIFAYPLLTTVIVGAAMVFAAHDPSLANVPAVPVSGQFGVTTHDARMALAVASAPMLLMLGTALGGGRCVQSLVGAEATNGAVELWLADGLDAADVVRAVWYAIATAVGAIWAATTVLVCAALGAVALLLGTGVHPTASYAALLLLAPLVLALAGTLMAVGLAFARPRLVQASERGIARGTGNVVGTLAAAPGFAVTVLVIVGSDHGTSAGALTACAAALTVVFAVIGAVLARGATRREELVGSQ